MPKVFSSKIFVVSPALSIVCTSEDTSYGFRHVARVHLGGWSGSEKPVSIAYYNRTWESFEFQSLLHKVADKYPRLTDAERALIREIKG